MVVKEGHCDEGMGAEMKIKPAFNPCGNEGEGKHSRQRKWQVQSARGRALWEYWRKYKEARVDGVK